MGNANVQYLVGDVFTRMAELPDASVDLILTSPPFLALRSYLPADHPDKDKEIGSEKTPAEFIDVLLRLTAEWRRLLAPHGSLVVELGDTFAGGGQGPDPGKYSAKDDVVTVAATRGPGWPLAKSLTLVPEAYRFALAYGTNPHTGQPSPAGQWRVRNVIRWVRPNPTPGALGDKFRPATSELVVACISKDRYFDLDAVREPASTNTHRRNAAAPPLDWWKISPKGYAGAHYAVWPSELCVKPIKAMCPSEVCRECGEPRRRVTDVSYTSHSPETIDRQHQMQRGHAASGTTILGVDESFTHGRADKNVETLGWSDCGHDNYRPGLVLDPFAGTGTTLAVAHGHGRDAIGIDIDERSAELARDRVGPLFLEVIGSTDGLRV